MNRYRRIEKLGSGSYGVVYKAQNLDNLAIVAIKKIISKDNGQGIHPTTLREISILMELKHPNIVMLQEVIRDGRNIQLVFEFSQFDLSAHIWHSRKMGGIPQHQVRSYMFQLLQGLAFCHSHHVIHRDLKPANILIDRNGSLKIADFGFARDFTIPLHTYTHEVFTLHYRAPEILLGARHYSTPADIWAAGCIFAELATSEPLFPGDCEIHQLFLIFRSLGTPGVEGVWPDAAILPNFIPLFPRWAPTPLAAAAPMLPADGVALLEKLLAYAPAARMSARVAMASSYFDNIRQTSGGGLSSVKTVAAVVKRTRDAQVAGSEAVPAHVPMALGSTAAVVVGAVRTADASLVAVAGLEAKQKATKKAASAPTEVRGGSGPAAADHAHPLPGCRKQ